MTATHYTHSRKHALEKGEQVDVSRAAAKAGLSFPVFLTRTVYDAYVTLPNGASGQGESGRLREILYMMQLTLDGAPRDLTRIRFCLLMRNEMDASHLVKLVAHLGPLDVDNPRPAITMMLPEKQ